MNLRVMLKCHSIPVEFTLSGSAFRRIGSLISDVIINGIMQLLHCDEAWLNDWE